MLARPRCLREDPSSHFLTAVCALYTPGPRRGDEGKYAQPRAGRSLPALPHARPAYIALSMHPRRYCRRCCEPSTAHRVWKARHPAVRTRGQTWLGTPRHRAYRCVYLAISAGSGRRGFRALSPPMPDMVPKRSGHLPATAARRCHHHSRRCRRSNGTAPRQRASVSTPRFRLHRTASRRITQRVRSHRASVGPAKKRKKGTTSDSPGALHIFLPSWDRPGRRAMGSLQ